MNRSAWSSALADWLAEAEARMVESHRDDARPVLLYDADGTLAWFNGAARFLGLLASEPVPEAAPLASPISGQVARLIRLGLPRQQSLSRVPFTFGARPGSVTCTTMVLPGAAGGAMLLLVGLDKVTDPRFVPGVERPPATTSSPASGDAEPGADLGAVARALDELIASVPKGPQRGGGEAPQRTSLYRVIGRYLRRADSEPTPQEPDLVEPEPDPEPPPPHRHARLEAARATAAREEAPPDGDIVERVSRYNFDELTRLLTERVGEVGREERPGDKAGAEQNLPKGGLIALGGETLVLNRLPIGILVFRDQQVLFANRAMVEITGHDAVESLRARGLEAIFPSAEDASPGPVNHLLRPDGSPVAVSARLQSISWQGRPALMLSANRTEQSLNQEEGVLAFARTLAETAGYGFFEADRSGTLRALSAAGAEMLGGAEPGRTLSEIIVPSERADLRDFLERPARFAETPRPAIGLTAKASGAGMLVFTRGNAGLVEGYFGLVRARARTGTAGAEAAPSTDHGETQEVLLARVSRGLRTPLATILAAANAIEAAPPETLGAPTRTIRKAGDEIATLVDELEDYARLKQGRYLPERANIDLSALLEACLMRVRPQASARRVIVRNAISEHLPRITADGASLTQAVLNLLASAVYQTPQGGAVVLSAQASEGGGIAIHVRDTSANTVSMSERFVVFRDGVGVEGEAVEPVRSSLGLALTRSLLAVNAFSLSVDPAGRQGMLFSMLIPADLVDR